MVAKGLKEAKGGARTFTFDIPADFREIFDRFQEVAGEGERSTAALLRVLIKKRVEDTDNPKAV